MWALKTLSTNPTKWSNTLIQFVFGHFVGLGLKGLSFCHYYSKKAKCRLKTHLLAMSPKENFAKTASKTSVQLPNDSFTLVL